MHNKLQTRSTRLAPAGGRTANCRAFCFLALLLPSFAGMAQQQAPPNFKSVFFPTVHAAKWQTSLGLLLTTMPAEVTEEFRFSVPAIDLHLNRRINRRLYLDARLNAQVLQNLVTVGPRWLLRANRRLSFSLGNDIGWWIGFVNLEGFRTRGNGWQNYPNLSVGYRFKKDLYLTVRGDALMNLGIQTRTGDITVKSDSRLFSGASVLAVLEQPFFGKKSMSLGFRATYTNFYWQTWSLFETFDRNSFYPQIIIGLIL